MQLFRLKLLPFLLVLWVFNANADFYIHSWQGHSEESSNLKLSLGSYYFTSSANFDAGGSINSPQGLRNYTRVQTDFLADYGLGLGFTAFVRTSWAFIHNNSDVRPGNAFGFADQTLGMTFRAFQKKPRTEFKLAPPLYLDLQIQTDFPGYSTAKAESQLTPYLGDGSIDFSGGFIAGIPIMTTAEESIVASVGAAYTYRNLQYSSAIPWMGSIEYSPYHDGFLAQLSLNGYTSLKTDPWGELQTVRSNAGGGGSFYIGATNPSLMTIRGKLGYKLENDKEAHITVSQNIWGQAAPQGFTLAFNLSSRWGTNANKNPIFLTPASYHHSNRGFVNYSIDAKVLSSNDRMSLVKINKGSQDGIEKGQIFDIFSVKANGALGEAVARAQVTSVKIDESVLDITEYFKEVWIEQGFAAKRLSQ